MRTEFFDEDGRCDNQDLVNLEMDITDIVQEFIKKNARKISGLHELRGIEQFLCGGVQSVTLGHICGGHQGWRNDVEQWETDDAAKEE